MMKKILFAAFAALLAGSVMALGSTGTPPGTGFQMVDGAWLNGLAGGVNNAYISGLTAAGTTQATCTPLPAGYYLMEADTVSASTGFCLPFAYQGADMLFYNNGAQTVTIYPSIANNPITAAQDTINNTTSVTVASHTSEAFSSAKNGVWFAK
jgi:hypothetical protein